MFVSEGVLNASIHIDEGKKMLLKCFGIINRICNGQPQDKNFTQCFYGSKLAAL